MTEKRNESGLLLRHPALSGAIGVIATIVLALLVVIFLLRTGGAKAVSDNAALIGAMVALGGVFTTQMVSIALDDRRTRESRELEAQRAHETALRNYFEQVGTLLIEQPLREASPGDNLSTVVRAQTLTVLQGLEPDRKDILLQFLYESGLIDRDNGSVALMAADLSRGNFFMADLRGAMLFGTNLRGAELREARLDGTSLRGTNLSEANLSRAELYKADLTDANLYRVNLRGANLREANLYSSATGGIIRAATFAAADLRGITIITNQEELERQALSLEGATMPDGSEHP